VSRKYPQLVFTDSVKAVQQELGTREQGARLEAMEWEDDRFAQRERQFIEERDSFYVASVAEGGWPYVQYRGGPRGFLRVLDERTLGFADFRGNLQYITTGNVRHDPRVALFLMDYPARRRLKIMARAEVVDASERPELLTRVVDPDYPANVERVVVYRLVAFDWNCPQHITPRFSEEEVAKRESLLLDEIDRLETENRGLRARLEARE
jgi:predicted pyridoxine 5'-phosphate oxidase superfamily flavin-nucleotide-binding protein